MNKLHLIGLHGLPGSGKDTFADAFIRTFAERGRLAVKLHFADPLRDIAEAAFGSRYETQADKARVDPFWHDYLAHNPQTSGGPWLGDESVTGRRILQFIGTELFRQHVHPDFWVLCMERRIKGLPGAVEAVVIPDVRFANEANFLHREREFGHITHLINTNNPPTASAHASDQPLPDALLDGVAYCDRPEQVESLGAAHAYRVHDAISRKELP